MQWSAMSVHQLHTSVLEQIGYYYYYYYRVGKPKAKCQWSLGVYVL